MGKEKLEKLEKIEKILDMIMVSSKNLNGCSIITNDGFSIANRFVNGIDEDSAAELSISLQKASETLSRKILNENQKFTSIRGVNGFITLTKLTSDSMLLLLTDDKASLGIITLEQKQNIHDLLEIL
ncbi:MAG: roadblock/LC7 domain-containing protein [Acidobacteriota bacterium]